MNQPLLPDDNPPPIPEPGIRQQVENSTLGGGMQAAIGDDNIQIQGDSNVVTFNKTEILQISVDEIKTREFIETSPYKGLKKFEPEDKDLFFGRDQFLTSLVNELEQTNLVLLLGASGSGKSSAVRAGLVPWLFQKYGKRLVNLIFTPDQDPFESLYASLLSKNTQSQAQIAREAKADTLTQVITRLKQADDYWFILIDQFEELFTTSEPEKRDRFIASLVQLAKAKLPSVKVIATMRADFLDKLSPYPALVKATDKHRPMIAEMQLDELRLAIEQPAAHNGVVFETGLVEEIIKDIQGQAGYLPLLQYTLNLLWETEVKTGSINDRTLNISTYRELGGVRGALQQRVDKIYEDLSAQEKIATQRIFLKLVDIGGDEDSGTDWKPVRRRALRSEFSDSLEQDVLVKLINNNLLVSDRKVQSPQSTIEIAHETLLTSWTTLNTWIKENRNSIALRNRLNDDVARWKAKKAEDELWTGSKLEQVLELRKDATFNQVLGGFSEIANQFINDSLGLRDRQLRRARRIAIGGLILTAFAATASVFGFFNQQESQKQSIIASTQSTEAFLGTGKQLDAMIEAIKAAKQLNYLLIDKDEVSTKVLGALQQVVHGVQERNRLRDVYEIKFSPDGKLLATSGEDGTTRLFNRNGKQLTQLKGHQDKVVEVVFSRDSKRLVTVGLDSTAYLWDTNGKKLTNFQGYYIRNVVFSPDGKQLATGETDGTVRLWNSNGKQLSIFRTHRGNVSDIAFSPDGKLLATVGLDKQDVFSDSTLRLWNRNGKQLAIFRKDQKGFGFKQVVFSSDSKRLATSEAGGIVKLWDINGKELALLRKSLGGVGHPEYYPQQSAEFSPNGRLIAIAEYDDTVTLKDANGKELVKLRGHEGYVLSVTFSHDSKLIATASGDGTTRLWDINGGELARFKGHTGRVEKVAFSPDEKLLATVTAEGTAQLWDINTKEFAILKGHQARVTKAAFSPNGELLAVAEEDSTLRLWDINGKKLKLQTHQSRINDMEFSPDGKFLVTAGNDSTLQIWGINGKKLQQFQSHQGRINDVEFSSDNRLFATAGEDGTAKLWSINGKELAVFKEGKGNVPKVEFSPNGKLLATIFVHKNIVHNKNTTTFFPETIKVNLYDTNSKHLAVQKEFRGEFITVKFSPDSKLLVTAAGGEVNLWNTQGKELTQFLGHSGAVSDVAFSLNGKLLATSGLEGTVRLWDTKGNNLSVLRGYQGEVGKVAFSPDSKLLASSGEDDMVRLWDIKGNQLVEFGENQNLGSLQTFSPNGKLLVTSAYDGTVRLWQVGGIDELLVRSCNWVRSYLISKPEDEPDRHLCDGIGTTR